MHFFYFEHSNLYVFQFQIAQLHIDPFHRPLEQYIPISIIYSNIAGEKRSLFICLHLLRLFVGVFIVPGRFVFIHLDLLQLGRNQRLRVLSLSTKKFYSIQQTNKEILRVWPCNTTIKRACE